jgi:hypothetical protein
MAPLPTFNEFDNRLGQHWRRDQPNEPWTIDQDRGMNHGINPHQMFMLTCQDPNTLAKTQEMQRLILSNELLKREPTNIVRVKEFANLMYPKRWMLAQAAREQDLLSNCYNNPQNYFGTEGNWAPGVQDDITDPGAELILANGGLSNE